jgi:hypothetical protein
LHIFSNMGAAMSDDLQRWLDDGRLYEWVMPCAPWWKRLPVIRRFRAAWASAKVAEHEAFHRSRGAIIVGYDKWVVWGMAHGYERKQGNRDE